MAFLDGKWHFCSLFSNTSMPGKVGRLGGPMVNYSNRKKQLQPFVEKEKS
jgi:hypothetical protein